FLKFLIDANVVAFIACLLVFPSACNAEEPERIRLTAPQLQKIPRWGTIVASKPGPISVDIGWRYYGDRFVAAVDFFNDTQSAIELNPIKSGCGCAGAHPVDPIVKRGESVPIVFRVLREQTDRSVQRYFDHQLAT
ncbi:MAG: hypothetical protein WBD20_17400, partial [Pirellulaceae bacterium]